MTHDELVEKAARAICKAIGENPDGICGMPGCNLPLWADWTDEARAAIDVVVEECAKAGVAAVNSCREDGESDMRAARSRVEQCIRALKQGDGE